jgi:hypothetical protein
MISPGVTAKQLKSIFERNEESSKISDIPTVKVIETGNYDIYFEYNVHFEDIEYYVNNVIDMPLLFMKHIRVFVPIHIFQCSYFPFGGDLFLYEKRAKELDCIIKMRDIKCKIEVIPLDWV